MGDRNWGLWSIPGSTSGAAVSTSVQAGAKRVPPKTPLKMTGTHRPPRIPAALSRRRGPPAQKMPNNYVSFKPPVVESEESSEEEISQDARDEIARMRARRAGEKGIVYVEPDQDEMDRRRERRTMSYDERHQTAPVSMNTMYDHLKKGPCKQTGYRPKVPVYETSSEEEVEPPKPVEKTEEKAATPKVEKIDLQPDTPANISHRDEKHSIRVENKDQNLEKKNKEIELPKLELKEEKPKTPSPKTQKTNNIEKIPEQKVLLKAEQTPPITETTPVIKEEPAKQVLLDENVVSSAVSPPQSGTLKSVLEPSKSSSRPSLSSADETIRENSSRALVPKITEKNTTPKPVPEKVAAKVCEPSRKEEKPASPKSSPSAGRKPEQSPKPISSEKIVIAKQADKNNNSKEFEPSSNLTSEKVIAKEKEQKEELPKEPDNKHEKPSFQENDIPSRLPPSKPQTLRDSNLLISTPENKDNKIDNTIAAVVIDKTHLPAEDSDLLSAAEKVSEIIEEKLSSPPQAEEPIVQDLPKIAEKSRSPSPSTEEVVEPPRKSKKKKKELDLPKEEDFSDFDEDFDFGFKDFDLVYYWTWDVANETCAICRNSLMDLDDSERTLIVWGDCGHSFHNNCMVQWTKNNPRCPLCQADWAISRIGQ